MPNKDEERSYLRMVYTEREFDSIEPYDPFPDWIMHRPGHPPFGVEVTESFHSETTARLLKDHSYRAELIRHRRYRHKDDIQNAQIVVLEIKARNIKTEGILVDMPPLSEYAPLLTARIGKESLRVASAPAHLNHVNLLIMDRDHRLSGTPVKDVCLHLLTPDMKRALIETPYREVFLVTSVQERGQCLYPLKLLFMTAEGFFFCRALDEFYANGQVRGLRSDEGVELCAEFLRDKGLAVGVAVRPSGRLEALFGNTGFSLTEDGLDIHDYHDHPLPATRSPAPSSESRTLLSPEFLRFFEEWSSRKSFTSGMAFPIAKQA